MVIASLQSRLDEFRKNLESGAPPFNAPHEAIEKMHRATAELKATGIETLALKTGDPAPEFSLFNQDRVQVNSADLLRGGPRSLASSEGTGDPTATWSWRLYKKSMQT